MDRRAIDRYCQDALSGLSVLQAYLDSSMAMRLALAKHVNTVSELWLVYRRKHYFLLLETQRQLHLLKSQIEETAEGLNVAWADDIGALLAKLDSAASIAQSLLLYTEKPNIAFIKAAMPALESALFSMRQDTNKLEKLLVIV